MCGIVGYVGPKQARDVVIDGLRRLEYRGYDSAGIALVHDGIIENFAQLRARIEADDHVMVSETDTEVLGHDVDQPRNLAKSVTVE